MGNIRENINCYASPMQREVLIQLITHPDIEKNFFLTGGTALSVFYLHHRLSDDLDLFAKDFSSLAEIDFWIKTNWPKESVKIKEAAQFLSLLIKDVKIDFVIDTLST
ncbi:MAG: nucleotidyl transferase AbiEii/AbiGii toxin family protein, partial [Deltaproteobacteria bacterium]|nr:nucleotidyl transferase AbiEii/AbiGii toxin family protein [Deltaproteobacteria bacterium]